MEPPDILEHFQILRTEAGKLWELGRGAMGVTYKALDSRLQTTVAIKVINPEIAQREEVARRFFQEARAAARLRHPNIASVHHVGESAGCAFYVMEYCDGPTIQKLVGEHGPLTIREALVIALQVAQALVVAEQHKLLHRDLKPSNMIITSRPDALLALKVIDFGLACSYGGREGNAFENWSSAFTGTVWFASPEQLQEHELDIRSDFYSLGACIWYMLTGKAVFSGGIAEVIAATLNETPPLLDLPLIPINVKELIVSLLAKNPAHRPASALALCSLIECCLASLDGPSTGSASEFSSDGDRSTARARRTTDSRSPESDEGGTIADYVTDQQFDQYPSCNAFEGRRIVDGEPVCIYIVNPIVSAVPIVLRELVDRLERIRTNPFKSIKSVLAYGQGEKGFTIVSHPMCSGTAFQFLRMRGTVRASEAVCILEPIAAGFDHLEDRLPGEHSISLANVEIQFEGKPDSSGHFSKSVNGWPGFRVYLNALGLNRLAVQPGMETFSSMNTVGSGGVQNIRRSAAAVELSSLFYELVSGTPVNPESFVPIAILSGETNELINGGISGNIPTASLWIAKLQATLDVEIPEPIDETDTGDLGAKPKPPWKRIIYMALSVPVLLAAGWLATALWHSRHSEDPRASDTTISILDDIARRRHAMNATLSEIETVQLPRLLEAKRNAEQSPNSGWEENVKILSQAIQKREESVRQDRAYVKRFISSLIDSWEAYPGSYEESVHSIVDSPLPQQDPEITELGQAFLERFKELHENPDRTKGENQFVEKICPSSTIEK